jgi:hypothetical protein
MKLNRNELLDLLQARIERVEGCITRLANNELLDAGEYVARVHEIRGGLARADEIADQLLRVAKG